ncbi:MAG TPA: F0F1 ATP synthase subunit A, partial [Anaerolineae bacterium]|nr:F0F1 ATP synthase subunit A [Anaerolineae bacterium]
MKKLFWTAIVIVLIMFVCGCGAIFKLPTLAQYFPATLPPITVEAEPVLCLGGNLLDHCAGGFAITNSLIATLIVDALLIVFFLIAARRPKLIPSGIQNFFETIIDILYNQAQQVAGSNAAKIFPIGATIFLFVFFANYMELVPGVDSIGYVVHAEEKGFELNASTPAGSPIVFLNPSCPVLTQAEFDKLSADEQQARSGCQPRSSEGAAEGWEVIPAVRTATTDINTTLALALAAVAATQVYGVMGHMPRGQHGVGAVLSGIKRYLSKFFNIGGMRAEGAGKVFGAVDLFASLLEGLSEFVKVISFTFRLFGNIFAGTILIFVVMSLIPYV